MLEELRFDEAEAAATDEAERRVVSLARQAATVGRALFHLDGPDAAKHIDALLEVPELQAIQFTPGAQSPSAMRWIPMMKKIRRSGRSVQIICPPEEMPAICELRKPE